MIINEEEKQKEIEQVKQEHKYSSRSIRRKLERELRKKYNDSSIKIGFGKTFKKSPGLSRKDRRRLSKDTNLIKKLTEIIAKYFPELLDFFQGLTDIRNKNKSKYSMKTICVTRLFGLICGLTSMTAISDVFNTDEAINNISKVCGQDIKELPYWQTIQDVFMNINTDELREIQTYIVKTLIRSKMFDKYRYKGCFQLIFDGTGLTSHSENIGGTCLTRHHSKSDTTTYHKYVLECKLVAR